MKYVRRTIYHQALEAGIKCLVRSFVFFTYSLMRYFLILSFILVRLMCMQMIHLGSVILINSLKGLLSKHFICALLYFQLLARMPEKPRGSKTMQNMLQAFLPCLFWVTRTLKRCISCSSYKLNSGVVHSITIKKYKSTHNEKRCSLDKTYRRR